jgi:condensin complex subunit 1
MSDEFELQDALQSLQDIPSYEIPNEHDLHDTEPGPLLQRASNLPARVQVVSDHPVSQMP